jgi:hypothetical protein
VRYYVHMPATKKTRAADEFRLAQAFYTQAMMHRWKALFDRNAAPVASAAAWKRAHDCIDSARFHLLQCGAILGLNRWPS